MTRVVNIKKTITTSLPCLSSKLKAVMYDNVFYFFVTLFATIIFPFVLQYVNFPLVFG